METGVNKMTIEKVGDSWRGRIDFGHWTGATGGHETEQQVRDWGKKVYATEPWKPPVYDPPEE